MASTPYISPMQFPGIFGTQKPSPPPPRPRQALTFGVEIECSVGTLATFQAHRFSGEKRVAHFPSLNPGFPGTTWNDVADHIRKTLAGAGFPVQDARSHDQRHKWEKMGMDEDAENLVSGDTQKDAAAELPGHLFRQWEVGTDGSVHGPKETNGYNTVSFEIRSPAYFYSFASLAELARAVKLLNNAYLLHVNRATGLHVHVGNGLNGFPLHTMQRLLAFLFAFEPQLNSLHPPSRFNTRFAASLRHGSCFSANFQGEHGRRPRPLEGVAHFLSCDSWDKLVRDAGVGFSDLACPAYRFADLAMADKTTSAQREGLKLTMEFRQHAGSVNSEEIVNWVRTVVGIVSFVLDTDPVVLGELMAKCEDETLDNPDGEQVEPILAETGFTIFDLLERMRLWEPLEYYRRVGKYRIRSLPEKRSLRVMNPNEESERTRAGMEELQRVAALPPPTEGFLRDPHNTSSLPTSKVAHFEEPYPVSDFSTILNGLTDRRSEKSGIVIESYDESALQGYEDVDLGDEDPGKLNSEFETELPLVG